MSRPWICDVCGGPVLNKGWVVRLWRWRYQLFPLSPWSNADVCDECIKAIGEAVKKARKGKRP